MNNLQNYNDHVGIVKLQFILYLIKASVFTYYSTNDW